MANTLITHASPLTIKKWSGELALVAGKDSYFAKRFIGKGPSNVVQQRTELEDGPGDQIQYDLLVSLNGRGTAGDNRVGGNLESLKFASDYVLIDQFRKGVSGGGKMSQKRTMHDLRSNAKDLMGGWWARTMDELLFMYTSGARGNNADFIEPVTFTGHAGNSIVAPDASHIMYCGAASSKATVANTDIMSTTVIERAVTKATTLNAVDRYISNIQPIEVDGSKHFVLLMSPFQAYSLRNADTTGWIKIQQAAITAEGKKNPIFVGGLGLINNVILHEHISVITFGDYGAGANLPAARALLLGKQAAVIAFGSTSGMRFDWKEEMIDYDNVPTFMTGLTFGIKKCTFNPEGGSGPTDFGVMAIDGYAVNPG